MQIAGFEPLQAYTGDDFPGFVRRFEPRDNTPRSIVVQFFLPDGIVRIDLAPTIGAEHTLEDHMRNQDMGAVAFKVMMTLAEAGDGIVMQKALRGECYFEQGHDAQVIAHYPDMPLRFENLCFGFRQVLGRGVENPPG